MKPFKNVLFSAMLTLGAFGAITYTACNKDECKDVVCQNGGTCSGGSCTCPVGYEGSRCETMSATKFLGASNGQASYNFSDIGGTGCGTYTGTLTMELSSVNNTTILIKNLGGFGTSTTVVATVNGNSINIASQAVTGASSNTISGSGTYASETITGTYTNTDGAGLTCTYNFNWTKQ